MSLLKWIYKRQGLLFRLVVCWVLSSLVMINDEKNNYDTRFQIRGPQKSASEIVILNIKPGDLSRYYDARTQNLLNLNQNQDFSEIFFWERELWFQLLSRLLDHQPQSVGVSLFFGDEIQNLKLTEAETQLFFDPRIFWASQMGSFDQPMTPLFAKSDNSNVGLISIKKDEDEVVRKVLTEETEIPHLAEKLSGRSMPMASNYQVINYRSPSFHMTPLSVGELLSGDLPKNYLKGKIVIIGAGHSIGSHYMTPVGDLSRAEMLAQITDNLIANRWITRYSDWIYVLYALILVIIAVLLITQYPQAVALFFYVCLSLFSLCLSIWFFDSYNIWIPAVSSLFLLLTVWIVFVGYQASKIERRNYMLEQEQRYLQELEQLKSNFVSLISHDLKTPLAKIQGIIDRIKATPHAGLEGDLNSLEVSTEELNRYIQSILKVMRVEARDFQLNLISTDLNELVEDVIRSLTPLADLKKITLEFKLEPLFLVDLDATLIREVIHNLIENAIKYSVEGKSISIQSFETETEIGFTVQDQGSGIPPEEMDSIWGKFVRGKNESHKSKGSGLGLYLVKYFVELHGGRVTLQSELGRGTQIGFFLPL